jgi:hypothetical protein
MDDGDSVRFRSLRFLNELAEIVRVAGQQHDRALQFKRRGGDDSIDGTWVRLLWSEGGQAARA